VGMKCDHGSGADIDNDDFGVGSGDYSHRDKSYQLCDLVCDVFCGINF
jgi:hypothetical protein